MFLSFKGKKCGIPDVQMLFLMRKCVKEQSLSSNKADFLPSVALAVNL